MIIELIVAAVVVVIGLILLQALMNAVQDWL